MVEEEFALVFAEASAGGVGGKVFWGDVADVVVGGVAVGDDQAADAGLGNHRAGVRQGYSGLRQEREDIALEAVVRAAGVAYARADEPHAVRQEAFPFAAKVLGCGFGQAHAYGPSCALPSSGKKSARE